MLIPDDGTSRRIVDAVRAADPALTRDQLAGWAGVDVSLVYHWESGARSITSWAMRRIVKALGDARPVLADLAAVGGCVVVRLPTGVGDARDALLAVVEAQARLGQLAQEAADAGSVESDGGTTLTPGERLRLRERIAPLLQGLVALDIQLRGAL